MPRFFNTAGPCRPEDHYMLPPERRLTGIRPLLEEKAYCVVHAPRQSGKTTSFQTLAKALTAEGRFAALLSSCETGRTAGDDVDRGVDAVMLAIDQDARQQLAEEMRPGPLAGFAAVAPEGRLKEYLTDWAERCPRPVVLFLDEIDVLVGKTRLSVLHQLRSGCRSHPEHFPRVIESLPLRNFTVDEVGELYAQHTAETGQELLPEAVERPGLRRPFSGPWRPVAPTRRSPPRPS